MRMRRAYLQVLQESQTRLPIECRATHGILGTVAVLTKTERDQHHDSWFIPQAKSIFLRRTARRTQKDVQKDFPKKQSGCLETSSWPPCKAPAEFLSGPQLTEYQTGPEGSSIMIQATSILSFCILEARADGIEEGSEFIRKFDQVR